MTSTVSTDTAGALLSAVRDAKAEELVATARQLDLAAAWADLHPAESIIDAAVYGDSPIPIAGAGAPLVAEFCLAELGAALGVSTDAGRALVADALDLRHRLPRLWSRVQSHTLPAWRARRIAAATRHLTAEAAAFVDRNLAPVAYRIGLSQQDRTIEAAVATFMPGLAKEQAAAAVDGRHVTVDHHQVCFSGTSRVTAEVDVSDAIDLDVALSRRAADLATLGSTVSLDARRATALGEIARRDLTLDLSTRTTKPTRARDLTLCVHLTGSADCSRWDPAAPATSHHTVSTTSPVEDPPRQLDLHG